MTQRRGKASLPISPQPHAGIINQCGFSDRGVARAVRQSNSQRRSRPFAIFDIADRFSYVNAFVVTFEVVEPNRAACRKFEGRAFIRHTLPFSRNYKAKSDAVIEGADFKVIVRAVLMSNRDARAAAIIHRSRMPAARRIGFANPVVLNFDDARLGGKGDGI